MTEIRGGGVGVAQLEDSHYRPIAIQYEGEE